MLKEQAPDTVTTISALGPEAIPYRIHPILHTLGSRVKLSGLSSESKARVLIVVIHLMAKIYVCSRRLGRR